VDTTPLVVAGIIAFLGLVALVVTEVGRRRSERKRGGIWPEVTRRMGGRLYEREGEYRLAFRWQGQEAQLREERGEVRLEIPGAKLCPREIRVGRYAGEEEFRSEADKAAAAEGEVEGMTGWSWRADRQEDALTLLTGQVRRVLVEAEAAELCVGPDGYVVRWSAQLSERLPRLAMLGLQLAMHASHAFAGDTGVKIVAVGQARGDCPVCGAALEGELVRCSACATPHHADCWSYVGVCSTFGCGSRASRP